MTDSFSQSGEFTDRLAHIPPGALDFAPVPVKGRHDGWTEERQRTFIERVAAGLGNSGAARAVGMSRQSAYALRAHAGAESFAAAWDRALAFSRSRPLPQGTSFRERAIEGIERPLRCGRRVIGSRRTYDRRALWAVLHAHYRRQNRL